MPIGLFGAGGVSKSFLARAPLLLRGLGPVAAPTYSVASRIVNAMKAGHPVRDLGAFQACRLVLVYVPQELVPESVRRLAAARIGWRGKPALVCGTLLGSSALAPLREAGAATGSLSPIEGSPGRFVVEGDRLAVRHAKRLVHDLGGRAVALDRSGVALYLAGLSLGSTLLTPLIAASVDCIAEAAESAREGMVLAHAVFEHTLRGYLHAGKKSWSGVLALGDQAALEREIRALERHQPRIAKIYRELALFGLEAFGRHADVRKRLMAPKEPGTVDRGRRTGD